MSMQEEGSRRSPQRSPLHSRGNSGIRATTPESKSTSYRPRSTSLDYIKAIAHHSRQSSAETLYPGEIYETLDRFLYQGLNTTPNHANGTSGDLAWLIGSSQSDSNRNQPGFEGFANPESCKEALRANIEKSHPQLLFLRGHPSPTWISSIGAFCNVDPELFRWFLRYRARPESDCYFDCAPSTMSNIFRFKFFTIGSRDYRHRSSQEKVDALRRKAAENLQTYRTELQGGWTLKLGDSILRNFHTLDERHCVIEQEIVISTFSVGKTWMAIACTDAGNDFNQGPPISRFEDDAEPLPIKLLPIIQYRPRCALKSRTINERTTGSRKGMNIQSLAIFPEGYGRGLDWSLAESNRFHILSDMFRLSAFSQKQLLNVMKEKITKETDRLSLKDEEPTLANLLYFRDILQDQLSNASHMLQLMIDQNPMLQHSRRPPLFVLTSQRDAADHAEAEVYDLLQDLHSQAQLLHEKCTQGMTVISNKSMLTESQRAMQQAKLVTKLTLVAFMYIPFSFTSAFFGMNFKEFGTGTISLWIFAATSVPLLLVTMAFFTLDLQTLKQGFQTALSATKEQLSLQ